MGKIIFIIGGARSGKSRYAIELAKGLSKKVVYIATCSLPDSEMKKRIKQHKLSRPRYWKIIEESRDIDSILQRLRAKFKVVLIDCIGLLVFNLLTDKLKDKEITTRIKKLMIKISKERFTTILVSNEVGTGLVPDSPLGRRFRDILGMVNQIIAEKAEEVIFMQSGIPIRIKNTRGING